MSNERFAHEIGEAVLTGLAAIAPAAAGSAIGAWLRKGLSWKERTLHFAAGIVVSWYANIAVGVIFSVHPFVAQAIGFTLGYLALDALPVIRERAIALLGDAFDRAREWVRIKRIGE
ncbi:MAG: hypothetical protein JWQ16_1752 [Novosphingobium sp.]|nr:hypothetical protein [Novosphingobium sp.]